ncbi:MAG: HPr family phosphocarrier protein [Verrucomicrobia bacterium]|nr:HPr family phosphocarrier protein [Verrucomicrobiota bacterium]
MYKGTFVVLNDKGLHTRPSTELAKCAGRFKASIRLRHRQHAADAKSVLSILMLAAGCGASISIEADGPDAEEAVDLIIKLAASKFLGPY